MNTNGLKTREEIRNEMQRKGVSYSEMARRTGQDRQAIYIALNTDNPCRFGKSHNAAVALGIKEGEIINANSDQ